MQLHARPQRAKGLAPVPDDASYPNSTVTWATARENLAEPKQCSDDCIGDFNALFKFEYTYQPVYKRVKTSH
jgi:hypothetical protein